MSSGTFLEELQMAKAEEWEKMRGALLVLKASLMVALAVWLRSISMPSLFISWTTVFPNAVRPPPGTNKYFAFSPSYRSTVLFANIFHQTRNFKSHRPRPRLQPSSFSPTACCKCAWASDNARLIDTVSLKQLSYFLDYVHPPPQSAKLFCLFREPPESLKVYEKEVYLFFYIHKNETEIF